MATTDEKRKRAKFMNWYKPSDDDNCLDAARVAFEEAKVEFAESLTRDKDKVALIDSESTIEHVLSMVNEAKRKYESKTQRRQVSRWLAAISSRFMYYGQVLDTLAQHHPEYVALAWGMVKLIFVGVLNHEELTSTFAKALCRIADCLPRQELYLVLYPTEMIKRELARLYSHLLQFLIRALKWYHEGIFKHIIHAFTQAVSFKYKDILENIEDCSRRIDQWAASSARAELRDVHTLQQEIHANLDTTVSIVRQSALSVEEIMKKVVDIAPQLVTLMSGQVNTNQRVFDLQLAEMLAIAAKSSLGSPEISYRYGILRRNNMLHRANRSLSFLESPKLKSWTTSEANSLVIVKGTYSIRDPIRIFGVEIIEAVQNAQIPALWALPLVRQEGKEVVTSIDVLKSLVQQAIRVNKGSWNESGCALSCTRMQSAVSESDWFNILGSALEGIPQSYIVFDASILGQDGLTLSDNFSWFLAFHSLLETLKNRNSHCVTKMIFLSYAETKHMAPNGIDRPEDFIVKIEPRTHNAIRQQRRRQRKTQYRLKDALGAKWGEKSDESVMELG